MKFEVGKCYRHLSGWELSIVGKLETTMFGEALIAEQNDNLLFRAVGSDEASAVDFVEISREEWMKNFNREDVNDKRQY